MSLVYSSIYKTMNRIEIVIGSTKTIDMKLELLVTQKHPKGDIKKGSIYTFDEDRNMYVLKNENGIIVASANEAAVKAMPHMFKKLKQ